MSWVGGDIPGLQSMGSAMSQATSKTSQIVSTLESKVTTLVDDAEWRGSAATAFRKVWSQSAFEVGSLNAVVTDVGTSVKGLASTLQELETALHDSANKYSAKGVPIGANGEPQTVVVKGDASVSPAKDVLQAAKEYKELYDSTLLLAKKARTDTANELSDLLAKLLSEDGPSGSQGGLTPDVKATALDYVRGLLVVPNEKRANYDELLSKLRDARQQFKDTRGPLKAAKAEYAAKGLKLPAASDAALAHSDALKKLNQIADKISSAHAPRGVLPGSEWLNIKLADLAGDSGALSKALPKLGFLKDIPVLDIAATGFIGGVLGYDDHNKGQPTAPAYGANLAAGAAGLAAGGLVAALAPEAAPVLAVAAVAGGVVVGVSNIGSALVDEHWMENIQRDGGVAGVAEGVGHSVSAGVKETGKQIADVSKSVWHGIFG